MKHRTLVTTFVGLIAASFAIAIGCGGRTEDHATDTKTNWLSSCERDNQCDNGLSCLCGVCTVGCAQNSTCETFDSEAGCFHAQCASGDGVCALPDTPLEGRHESEFENCPRPADLYSNLGDRCASAAFDCASSFTGFDDECGCGCEPESACDPELEYVGYGTECGLIDYDCPAGEEHVTDECGCACRPSVNPMPTCTQPADSYIADADECANTDFDVDCAPGSWFSDDCGCGCTAGNCDATVEYVAYGAQCESIDVECEEGEQQVTDDCGCGCKPSDGAIGCAREDIDYVAFGDECDVVAIDCALTSSYFRDDCGCGCAPNPECDPNLDYIGYGGCEGIDYDCGPGEVGFTDDCGCGCTPNPACDSSVSYVAYGACEDVEYECQLHELSVRDDCGCGCVRNPDCRADVDYVGSGCLGATLVCDEGVMPVWDDCGCGCPSTVARDGGAVPTDCPAPQGDNVPTEVRLSTMCVGSPSIHDVITSQEELEAVLTECGAVGSLGFLGQPLYVATVAERTEANHLYTIDADEGLHLGIEYPAYCNGAAPPTLLLVFAINGLNAESVVIEDVCNTGECSGPPRP